MSRKNEHWGRVFIADFETTVYDGQEYTEVWAAALVEMGTEDVHIFHAIEEFYDAIKKIPGNTVVYFHNLKFDGAFILDYLIRVKGYKQSYLTDGDGNVVEWMETRAMPSRSLQYVISNLGQWYKITVKEGRKYIEFRDSLKLLPFSVKKIGKDFKTKHQKTEIEYKGVRYAGCNITDIEKEYIANDVLVVKEALEIMQSQGHRSLTIGACCLKEYKRSLYRGQYNDLFPNLSEIEIDNNIFGADTADAYIRRSYRGGWCYLVKGKENKVYSDGVTYDVNSLYPSMMSGESSNRYPVGEPTFWRGDYIPEIAMSDKKYYFVRFRCRFNIKPGYLPFVQKKGSVFYKSNEMLETSDVYDKWRNCYYRYIQTPTGEIQDTVLTMTMTQTDFELFQKHYDVTDFEILDGCYFNTAVGLFDAYIEKYKKIKMESQGATRQIAKLFLNNLYGKMATGIDSSFKVACVRPDNYIGYNTVLEHKKKPGYIPVGSAITSYARCFTITAAQANFHGKDKPGFIYADTDSIHLDIPADAVQGIKIDDSKFLHWSKECDWDQAIFTRQKTYIEHTKDGFDVKCAGMTPRCKELFIQSMTGERVGEYTADEKEFLKVKRSLTDFKIGLEVPGKLLPKRVPGGVILYDTTFIMHQH